MGPFTPYHQNTGWFLKRVRDMTHVVIAPAEATDVALCTYVHVLLFCPRHISDHIIPFSCHTQSLVLRIHANEIRLYVIRTFWKSKRIKLPGNSCMSQTSVCTWSVVTVSDSCYWRQLVFDHNYGLWICDRCSGGQVRHHQSNYRAVTPTIILWPDLLEEE